MEEILGYSAYWHTKQSHYLNSAYKIKSEIVKKAQLGNEYGSGLDTLLLFYNFETEPDEFAGTDFLTKKIKVYRYSSKEKSLRVNIFVGFDELVNKSLEQQIEFYYQTTIKALEMVKEKFSKRRNKDVSIDFNKLIHDINQEFISQYFFLSIEADQLNIK